MFVFLFRIVSRPLTCLHANGLVTPLIATENSNVTLFILSHVAADFSIIAFIHLYYWCLFPLLCCFF